MDGLSNVSLRPQMKLEDFLERGAEAVGITLADLKARKRGASIVEGREILSWLGVELYGFTVRGLAEALDKHLETVSRLVSRAAMRRAENRAFRERINQVDSVIAGADGDGR
jgi:chromosomal replication initiation ATPase DnaA